MLTARPKVAALVLFSFISVVAAFAQSVDVEQREATWRSYKLPAAEFTRHVDHDKVILLRVPASWQQKAGSLHFIGPHDAELTVLIEKVPDGIPLRSYTNAVLRNLRALPGGADSLAVRRTEISSREAREFLFTVTDPRGQLTRRMIWSTVSGPHAISLLFVVPETNAEELEPYFKAVTESAVIFESDAEYNLFERLRSAAIKESKPLRIDEVRSLAAVIDGFDDGARAKAVATLASMFDSTPDAAVELLIDHHPLIRASAIEALGRSSNRALDGFLVRALADDSSAVAVRAARWLGKRADIVKLLREDSANWQGPQTRRLIRAIPFLDESARNQLFDELLKYRADTSAKPPLLRPPPPPPRKSAVSTSSKGRPGNHQTDLSAKLKSLGTISVSAASRSYNDNERLVLDLLPDLEALAPVLPADKLIEDEWGTTRPLRLALQSRTRLPVARLMSLLASKDRELTELVALNLAISATEADVPGIEEAAKKAAAASLAKPDAKPQRAPVTSKPEVPGEKFPQGFVISTPVKSDANPRRPLAEELRVTIKKIRWRERLQAADPASRDALFKEAFDDNDLAAWAWPYVREYVEGDGPKQPKPIRGKTYLAGEQKKGSRSVSQLAENLLPKNVELYAAAPNFQTLIHKLTESLSSIQLDSARAQAKLLLVYKGFETMFQKGFGIRAESSFLESSGIEPHSPAVFARWTADRAPRGLSAARRKAVIFRVKDRDRFENLIASYHDLGRFEMLPEYISAGARLLSALPAVLPFAASAISSGEIVRPPASVITTHRLMGYETCEGYTVTVFERRESLLDDDLNRDTIYVAYVGDVAVLTTDWFSLRDCLVRLEGKGETLEANAAFKQAVAGGGDIIYLSDPMVLTGSATNKPKPFQLTEHGALRISKAGWESSFNLSFTAKGWQKLFSFKPSSLKAPGTLLPRSSVAYLLMSFDFATAWRMFGSEFFEAEKAKQFKSIWSGDFDSDVLPELGPECGAALLGMPSSKDGKFDTPWALFVQIKSDKLAKAFAEGKLIKGAATGAKAARVKLGSRDCWLSVKNGFLVIAGSEASIDKLDSPEHLSAARDYERMLQKAPAEVVALGGCNLEAATAGVASVKDSPTSEGIDILLSLARAFHSLNVYATPFENGLTARMSVSLDREARYSLSELASLSKDFQFAAAEIEARGVPIANQRRIDSLAIRVTSKAPSALQRVKQDISSAAQFVEERPNGDLVVTIRPRRVATPGKVELPVNGAELAPFVKAVDDQWGDQTVATQAREIAGNDRDAWSVARKLADWTFKNLKWKRVDGASAASTLATREADCLEFSQLFVAMARTLGLPARIVSGLAHNGSSFGGHAWVEVWVGEWIELDPTWGTTFVDATHIKSSSSELLAYAALNLIGLEVLEAKRSVPDFQKDAAKLAEALCEESPADSLEDVLAVTIDPATLIDAAMGENTWSGMNAEERDKVYSAQRRLGVELREVLKDDSGLGHARVLNVKQQRDRAQALLMTPGWATGPIRLRLIRKGEVWFIEELRYEDSAYDVLSETARSIALVVRAKRNGTKPPRVVNSAETRILLAGENSAEMAVEIAQQALKENPNSPTLLFLKAAYLMNASKDNGDKAETDAIKILTELSDRQPAFAPAIRKLGDFYADVEDDDPQIESKRDRAIDLYQRYAALAPEDPRPHESLALIFEQRRDYARAEVEYRAVIERDPQMPDSYSELARFLVTQQRYKEALAAIDQSRGRGSSKDELFAQLFYAGINDREAAQRVEALAATATDRLAKNAPAILRLAWVRISNGRASEALPLLKAAAALDPKSAEPHVTMAEAYRKLHNWAAALKAAEAAISLDSEEAEAYFHKACALAQLRRPTESLAAVKKAIELDEDLMFTDELEAEEDLKPLAHLPAFKKLVKETKQQEEPQDDLKKKDDK